MFISLRNRVLKIFLLGACLVLLALHLCVPINLTAVDIGRHIKNGELVLSGQYEVLYKNFYSFTYPDYPFINHHWLFGVIAYSVYRMSTFEGLSVFYILLLVLAFLLAFDSARRFSNFSLAIFLSVVSFLLLDLPCGNSSGGLQRIFCGVGFLPLAALFTAQHQRPCSFYGAPHCSNSLGQYAYFLFYGACAHRSFFMAGEIGQRGQTVFGSFAAIVGCSPAG